jgi:hypothetical protein
VISKEKEKFNVEQDNYMWYFRNVLLLPDVRLALEGAKADANSTTKKQKKKGFFGFFSDLFAKKNKDTKQEPVKPADELTDQPSDSTSAVLPVSTDQPKKKKGLFSWFKRKSKQQNQSPAPQKKEEEEEEEKF